MARTPIWIVSLFAFLLARAAWAQGAAGAAETPRQALAITWGNLVASVVYGVVGVLLLIGAYYLYELITPYSVRKELIEDQNIALAIVVGAVILGMAIIIASAIF